MGKLTGVLLKRMAAHALAAIERERARLDGLNVFPVPDGDTGTNMALTLRAALGGVSAEHLAEAARQMAHGALRGARGNSGTILSQFVEGFSQGVAGLGEAGPLEVARALVRAAEVAYQAVVEPQEGTMLTVGREAAAAALAEAERGGDLERVLAAALEGAAAALERTPELLPILKEAGVVDAGGEGLVVGGRAALAALMGEAGEEMPAADDSYESVRSDLHERFAITETAITFKYCTEFLVAGTGISLEALRERLLPLGDSLLVVGGGSLVKVHLHTDHPGRALEIGCEWGDLSGVSVANMQEQNRAAARGAAHSGERSPGGLPPDAGRETPRPVRGAGGGRAVGVVAVSLGRGFRALFESCGAAAVVSAPENLKPSVDQLLAAIEEAAAERVILIPGHRDVVLAANQAAALAGREVVVLPATSPPAALSAMLRFEPAAGFDRNVAAMRAALEEVRSAEVARAVRDAAVSGVAVRGGEYVALADGRLLASGADLVRTLAAAAAALGAGADALVTLYHGEAIPPEVAQGHAAGLRQALAGAGCEVEVYEGGQSASAYWIAVE